MQKTEEIQNQKYSFLAKFFHWGFVFLFGYGIFKQVDDIEQLENISLLKFEILFASIFLFFFNLTLFLYEKNTNNFFASKNTKTTKVCRKISSLLYVYMPSFYMHLRINDRTFLLVRIKKWNINWVYNFVTWKFNFNNLLVDCNSYFCSIIP